MSVSQLPLELISNLLEPLYFKESGYPDRQTLKTCSLVCTAWTIPAQKLLFRYGCLSPLQCSAKELLDIFTNSTRGRALASYVRTIDITVQDHTGTLHARFTRKSYPHLDFISIIKLFPRLYELFLRYAGPFVDLAETIDIAYPPLPSLRSLSLRMITESNPGLVYKLLAKWTTIKFLEFSTNHAMPLPPSHPNTLTLLQISYFPSPSPEVLQWLVPGQSLRILQIKSDIGESQSFVESKGAFLRSLQTPWFDYEVADLLVLCPNLEELDIIDMSWDYADWMKDCLAKTIGHLRLRRVNCSGGSVMALVRCITGLKFVTLPKESRDEISDHTDWVEFEEECSAKGLGIIWTSFDAYLDDDPVMVTRFPRGRSTANFGLMS